MIAACVQGHPSVIWNFLTSHSSTPHCERFFCACLTFNGEASGIRKDPNGLCAVRSAYPATLKAGQSFNHIGRRYG